MNRMYVTQRQLKTCSAGLGGGVGLRVRTTQVRIGTRAGMKRFPLSEEAKIPRRRLDRV